VVAPISAIYVDQKTSTIKQVQTTHKERNKSTDISLSPEPAVFSNRKGSLCQEGVPFQAVMGHSMIAALLS